MTGREAFIAAVAADPEDDTARLKRTTPARELLGPRVRIRSPSDRDAIPF